ncbi:MAG: IS5 family transposase, partial [Desulfobacterales bacterium]
DSKTIWLFREQLVKADLIRPLFHRFNEYLESKGYVARKGQMVDASIVDAPKQRNGREENAQIKAGEVPERFRENPNVGRQKDTEARWTKKNHENRYGYKNHISADVKHKLIRDLDVTPAHVHDSQVFLDILAPNTSKEVWADSAYRSAEIENALAGRGYRSRVHRKGTRKKPLSEAQQRANRRKSSIRVRIEHIFGAQSNEQAAGYIRTIGLSRALCKIGLTNLVYNLRRMVLLDGQVAPV